MTRSINEVAIGLLSRREHSILELKRKLGQKSFTEDEIEQAIQRLLDNNLLSEERFTESCAKVMGRCELLRSSGSEVSTRIFSKLIWIEIILSGEW